MKYSAGQWWLFEGAPDHMVAVDREPGSRSACFFAAARTLLTFFSNGNSG